MYEVVNFRVQATKNIGFSKKIGKTAKYCWEAGAILSAFRIQFKGLEFRGLGV